MRAIFKERGIRSEVEKAMPSVNLRIESYSNKAVGGSDRALIKVEGDYRDLLMLLDWLRVKVEIDDRGKIVWRGYIHRVEVEFDKIKISADISSMSNRIAVAYTQIAVGEETVGDRATTAWAEDAESIRNFGYKELLESLSDTTATIAQKRRDLLIAERKLAQAGFEPGGSSSGATATIECKGWWDTLSWRYAAVPTMLAYAYETIGELVMAFGDGVIDKLAQAFTPTTAITLQEVELYLAKGGAPADTVKVAIYSNPDGVTPTTELGSDTIAAADISTTAGWVRVTFDTPVSLTAGTPYFLVVERSGGDDAVNYYTTTVDLLQGYGGGIFTRHNGTSWSEYAADLPFRLYDNVLVETTQQIASLISSFGQFLMYVRVEDVSGVTSESYRFGDSTAQEEIEKLMDAGTTNSRRILAEVQSDNEVRIYEQGSNASGTHFIDSMGNIYDPYGSKIDNSTCPVGVWVAPKDITFTQSMTFVGGLQAFFLEEATYTVNDDKLSFRASNQPDPLKLEVRSG